MAKGQNRNDEADRVEETRVAPLDDDDETEESFRTERTQAPPATPVARAPAGGAGRKTWGNQTRTAPATSPSISASMRAPESSGVETRMPPPPVPDEDLVLETRLDGMAPPPPPGARGGDEDEEYEAPATLVRPNRGGAKAEGTPAGGRRARGRGEDEELPEPVRPGRAVTRDEAQGASARGSARAEGQDLPEIIRPGRAGSRDEAQGASARGGPRAEGQDLPELVRPGRAGARDEAPGASAKGGSRAEGEDLPELVRPGRAGARGEAQGASARGGSRAEGQDLPEIIRPGRAGARDEAQGVSARGASREEGQDLPELVRPGRAVTRDEAQAGARPGRAAPREETFELPEIIHAGRGAELDGSGGAEPPRAAKASRPEPMIFAPLPSAQAASQAEQTPELRTMFATHSALLAERLKAEVQHKIYGRTPHRILRVDEPEGPSTAGGKQARQAISLVDRKGVAPALVAGWVDVAKGQASLRNFEAVAKRYEFQHGSPLELAPEEYEKFLTDVDEVLRTAAIQVRILVPDESAPVRATVGQQTPRASGVPARWVALLVLGSFLLGWAARTFLPLGG
jgi:hypothetical protein